MARLDGTSLFTNMNSGLNNTFSVLSTAFVIPSSGHKWFIAPEYSCSRSS